MDDSLSPSEKPEDPEKAKKEFEKGALISSLLSAGVGWLITGEFFYAYSAAFLGYCGWGLSRDLPQGSRLGKVWVWIIRMAAVVFGIIILLFLAVLVGTLFEGGEGSK